MHGAVERSFLTLVTPKPAYAFRRLSGANRHDRRDGTPPPPAPATRPRNPGFLSRQVSTTGGEKAGTAKPAGMMSGK
jgi:hypothetical protein